MTIELSDCETVLNGRKKTVICVEFLGYIFHAAMPAFAVRPVFICRPGISVNRAVSYEPGSVRYGIQN